MNANSSVSFLTNSASVDCTRLRLPFLKPRDDKVSAFTAVTKSKVDLITTKSSYDTTTNEIREKTNMIPAENVKSENEDKQKRPSICSQEVHKVLSHAEALDKLSSSLSTQLLLTKVLEEERRPESPVPSDDGKDFTSASCCRNNNNNNNNSKITSENRRRYCVDCDNTSLEVEQHLSDIARPLSVRSLSPNVYERPLTPAQIVSFPPEIPTTISIIKSTNSNRKTDEQRNDLLSLRSTKDNNNNNNNNDDDDYSPSVVPVTVCLERSEEIVTTSDTFEPDGSCSYEIERIKQTIRVKSPVPFDGSSAVKITDVTDERPFTASTNVSLTNLPISKDRPGFISAAATIAPDRPFTPVKPIEPLYLQKPVHLPEETVPYDPSFNNNNNNSNNNNNVNRPTSPLVKALTTASERSYSPLPTEVVHSVFLQKSKEDEENKREKRISMSEALATAPKKSYSLTTNKITTSSERKEEKENKIKLEPLDDPSIILRRPNLEKVDDNDKRIKKGIATAEYPIYDGGKPSSVSEELKKLFENCKNQTSVLCGKATELIRSTASTPKCGTTRSKQPFTSTGLHKAVTVPYYQQCVEELTAKNKTTPSSSSRSTPIPAKYSSNAEIVAGSRKSTPLSFQAKVYLEQRKFPPSNETAIDNSTRISVKENTVNARVEFEQTGGVERKLHSSIPFFSEKLKKEVTATKKNSSEDKNWEITKEEIDREVRVRNVDVKEEIVEKLSITLPTTNLDDSTKLISSNTITVNDDNRFKSIDNSSSTGGSGANLSSVVAQLTHNLAKLSSSISADKRLTSSFSPLSCSNIRNKKPVVCTTSKLPKSSSEPKPTGGTDGIGNNAGFKSGSSVGYTAPRRGRGVLNQQNLTPGARIPLCAHCNSQIRGPFVTALGKIWCPEHFVCVNQSCHRTLMDIGFVEEPSGLYCEYCFEQFLAPTCSKCAKKIKGDCLNAIGKHFHPECFTCAYCGKLFGNNPFFLEEGLPYCENDWNELFTTKCFACGFPIEAGDRWVEALNNNYHSPCFNCTICKINLEGQSFYAKGGRPFCKNHAR